MSGEEGVVLDLDAYRARRVREGTWPVSDEETKAYWVEYRARKGRVKFDHPPFKELQTKKVDPTVPVLPRDEQNRLMDEMIRRDQEKLDPQEDPTT